MNLPNQVMSIAADRCSARTDQLLNALLHNDLVAIAYFDVNLKFQQLNKTFVRIFEKAFLPQPGNSILDLHLNNASAYSQSLNRLANSEINSFDLDAELFADISKSGSGQATVQYLNIKVQGIYDKKKFDGGFMIVTDRTTEVEINRSLRDKLYKLGLKQEAAQAQKSKGSHLSNFARMASHDMKEPLRMICNFSKLIERRAGDTLDPVSREYMQYVVDGAQNINTLVQDLMDYTSICEYEIKQQDIKVSDLLLLLKSEFHKDAIGKDIDLYIAEMPDTIVGDWALIKAVFKNLIHNAMKFKSPERDVQIELEGKDMGAFWQFVVKDNGIGIQETYYQQVFEIFKRLHSKQQYKGSGVGLTIAEKIVSLHRGKIWVESVYGKGSSFYFTISRRL